MMIQKISLFTTFFTPYHDKPFTFHYQTPKHYQRNNIPVFESMHSMLNLHVEVQKQGSNLPTTF